jgi:hypothetical protein
VVVAVLFPLTAWAAPPADVADSLRAHFRAGRTADAQALIDAEPGVYTWDRQSVVRVTCTFRSRAEGLTFRVARRAGVKGDLVVAFPPGILALPDRARLRSSNTPQDLILLRAPVVVLAARVHEASVQVPVACASFRRQGPKPTQAYFPRRVTKGTALDRLARVLCAGDPKPTPETALAIWVAHEALGFDRLDRGSFRTFPTPRERVRPSHGAGAARLIREAGLKPSSYPFFRKAGTSEPERSKPRPKERKASPRPGGIS